MEKIILVNYINIGKYKGRKLEEFLQNVIKTHSKKEGNFIEYWIPTNGESKVECIYPNNIPIHIHEGVENIHVYIENGVVNIKKNKQLK